MTGNMREETRQHMLTNHPKIHEKGVITMSAIFDEVRAIIVERLGVEEGNVTLEATFKDDLNADSLDVVEMVMAFEDAFDIEIPDEIAEQITNVKGVVEYVEKVKANA